jgi:hypothetical protein
MKKRFRNRLLTLSWSPDAKKPVLNLTWQNQDRIPCFHNKQIVSF